MRGRPSPRAVPAIVTPKPAMVSVSPTATRRGAAERRRHDDVGQRRGELDQRDIGGGAAGGVAREIEARVPRDRAHRRSVTPVW